MTSRNRDDATTIINKLSDAASLEAIARRLRQEAAELERNLLARPIVEAGGRAFAQMVTRNFERHQTGK